MPLEAFKSSESLTLGVELELQLVNTYDFDLSSSADDLLELLGPVVTQRALMAARETHVSQET